MRYIYSIFMAVAAECLFAQTYNITDFGAIGDSVTLNTSAIQRAIDSCSQNGGGRVLIPHGIFLTGTLIMKSHVELHIDSAGTLKGSANLNDYPTITPQLRTFTDQYVQRSLIYAEGVSNIAFTGKGKINGNGLAGVFLNSSNRVFGFRIFSSSNVRYEGLTLLNSAFWMMHNCQVDTLVIRNLTITNHCYGNQDGVNIDMCRNVLVENCDIDSNNDPVVLKGTAPLFTNNVEVRNCTLATYSRAIKIGTETQGFFSNIFIHDCVVKKSSRGPLHVDAKCGINLSIVDGGGIDGVRIENIQLEAITPLMIRLGNLARKHTPTAPTPGVGFVRNITLKNIRAKGTSNITSHITGIPNYKPENISLENIHITVPGGMDSLSNFVLPENENKKPEHNIFGDTIPAHGFFIRHIKNIRLCQVKVSTLQPDNRPYLILDDVEDLDSTCVNEIVHHATDEFRIYPNPAVDWVHIEDDGIGNKMYEVYDILGRSKMLSNSKSFNVSTWNGGAYIVKHGSIIKLFIKE